MERLTLARWLSLVLHPFVMIGVMAGTAAAARQPAGEAVMSVAIVAMLTIVPLAVLMWRQVRRGRWANADASNRAERPILYVASVLAVVALLAYFLLLRPQSFMVRGVVATLGMLGVCGAATRWRKVSLHMGFASLAATALVLMQAPAGYVLLLGLPALVWSRLTLRRHTPLELALGTIIGAGTGAAIHYV
jgi:membrane-associated phospholipid phosphatase